MGAQTAENQMRIYMGLFAVDTSMPLITWGPQLMSRFTRELPQTLLGLGVATVSNIAWQVDRVEYYGGATVSSGRFWNSGAIALGNYITGNRTLRADPNNPLFQHEYGHFLQSRASGLRYLFDYGIPSLISAIAAGRSDISHDHSLFFTEQGANKMAYTYFYNKYGRRLRWNFDSNPIVNETWLQEFHQNRGYNANDRFLYRSPTSPTRTPNQPRVAHSVANQRNDNQRIDRGISSDLFTIYR